jgi:poly-gamma-glutamate synthesis protein (capsule biosynthesis protein)
MATILIGGDICPIGDNAPLFERGDAEGLFHDVLRDFDDADLVVANLECPLVERPAPIQKTGPVFGATPACINGIKAAGIDALCLANNHILDHGPTGLATTIATCAQAGVATVGAGDNLAAARRILIRTAGGIRIGLLAMAEREFSIATAESPGANPLDVIDYVRNVSASRTAFDFLVVLLHGGAEFLTAPSPRLQDTCRFLVEMGANAVVVQHPHSVGGYEQYNGGHIVYGQGALVMDEALYRDLPSFHEGMLIRLVAAGNGTSSIELIPIVQSDHPRLGARRMGADQAKAFLSGLSASSRALLDAGHVRAEWRRYCKHRTHDYLSALMGHGRLLRLANRRGHLTRLLYRRRRLLMARNVVCCEAHREAAEKILSELLQ